MFHEWFHGIANMAGAVLLSPALAWLFFTIPGRLRDRLASRP